MEIGATRQDWDPAGYGQFRDLRLRPALDLLAQVPDLPPGPVVDLGCGAGAAGPALTARFPDRTLWGLDRSPAMLEEAEATGLYRCLCRADIAEWAPPAPPALIFANAALNWVSDHAGLLPRLAGFLAPGGVLAMQAPRQQAAPSHAALRDLSARLFPDRFDWSGWREPVLDIAAYDAVLQGLGEVSLWETVYAQTLPPAAEGHPVRAFTAATAARPVLERLDPAEAASFMAAYDGVLQTAYPRRADGSVLFPFRRIFLVLRVPWRDAAPDRGGTLPA